MKIKAQALINGAHWIEETHGPDVLEKVLAECSPEIRLRLAAGTSIEWQPVEEFIEFLAAAVKVVRDPKITEKIGAAGARANLRGIRFLFRLVAYLTRPDYILARSASLWRQYNDEGTVILRSLDRNGLEMEVVGIKEPNRLFCSTLTGWGNEIVSAAGAKNPQTRHAECRATGAARCVWHVRWALAGEPGDERYR